MFRHHLKIAIRSLWKHRGYSLINIAGLALGMAFAIMILLWVRFEVQFDRFHENVDRLYLVAFTPRRSTSEKSTPRSRTPPGSRCINGTGCGTRRKGT
jgi:putative ABC transport system permease protein